METFFGSKECQVTGGYGCGQVMAVTAGDRDGQAVQYQLV